MKNQLLIIEDNIYSYFTTKQILEAQLHLEVEIQGTDSKEDLINKAADLDPNSIIIHPKGGIGELLKILKKRNISRLDTKVTIMITNHHSQNKEWLEDLNRCRKGSKKSNQAA